MTFDLDILHTDSSSSKAKKVKNIGQSSQS